jgi:hypothetical protein
MDQFSGHQYDNLATQCADNNIEIKYFIPHTLHLCKPLDLVTFVMMKCNLNACKSGQGLTIQTNKIFTMINAWQKSSTIMTTIATFSAAGIVSQREYLNHFYYCSVDLTVSIHLADIENMISMQNMMAPISTPVTSADVHEASRDDKVETDPISPECQMVQRESEDDSAGIDPSPSSCSEEEQKDLSRCQNGADPRLRASC